MKNNCKKVIGLLVVFLFCGFAEAQDDSTDLHFYAAAPEFETMEQSEYYEGLNMGSLWLDFELTDISAQKIWVELLRASNHFGSETMSRVIYTRQEIEESVWYDEGSVHMNLGLTNLDHGYSVFIRLEDEDGLLIIFLTKTLEQ